MKSLKEKLATAQLYVLMSNLGTKQTILKIAKALLEGGVDILQLREKSLPEKEFTSIATDLQDLVADTEGILIINDYVRIANQINAAGVHIGQDDMDVEATKKVLGDGKIVGISTHNIEQFKKAKESKPDYIAVGPIFPTKTKSYEPVVGLKFACEVTKNLENDNRKQVPPVFAIGGINLENLGKVIEAGISRIAVSSAIIESNDITQKTREFKSILEKSNL